MRGQSYNHSEAQINAKAATPDVSDLVRDYYWREVNGYREHIRRADGFVVTRERMPAGELGKSRPVQQRPQRPREKIMQDTNPTPAQKLRVADLRIGLEIHEWTVKSLPYTAANGRRLVDCECSCGTSKPVGMTNLLCNGSKSCGHARRPAEKPVKASRSAAAERAVEPRRAKRVHKAPPASPVEAPKPARNVALKTSLPAQTVETKAVTNGHVDFARLGEYVDGITKLARLIPIAQVEAMAAEIARLEAGLPVGHFAGLADVRAQIAAGKHTATAFLEFRRQLESV